MKLNFFPILIIGFFLGIPAGGWAQITNPGFENWTNGLPDGWYTYSSVYSDVVQTTAAHSGTSALKASVVLVKNAPVGSLLQAGSGAQGFPITQRYDAVTGYYRFVPTGGDVFSVNVIVYVGTKPVGSGVFETSTSTLSFWMKFTVPIKYTGTETPQSIAIQALISPKAGVDDPHVGSYYLLDDLSLVVPTDVKDAAERRPATFALDQNFPNPFNPSTSISFSLPERTVVSLKIRTMLGQDVATLASGELPAGNHVRRWEAAGFPSGLYFCTLQAGALTKTRAMLLVR
jgi:hypothetical protein